ncbi:MAG: S8 family peptidase [Verrucomicrobiota bacterium]|jgi:subtilisin family serine protease
MRGIVMLVWAAMTLAVAAAQSQRSASASPATASKPYRTDRILIQPKSGTSLATLQQFHARHHCRALTTFKGIRNLQVLEVPPGETVESLVVRYQQSGLVEFAEPDYTGHLFDTTPNDPAFVNGTLWGLYAISAPAAWDVLTAATNIVVAVVDTGVRYTHQDLASNMWVNPNDGGHGWNALSTNNNPTDAGTHGTMVAGVLGAVGNNGIGVVGVAWRIQIMACSCFNSLDVGNISDVITCLDYARTNGARIINASWGFTNSLALSNALVCLRDAGIIVVAAAGNSTNNIDLAPNYPAGYGLDNVVTVASTSRSNTLSSFSNYGAANVALAAPGEQIYSTFPATDSYYYTESGTSFSAPYVAGACALLMAQYPADTYRDTIGRLLSSTDPLPALAGKCRTGGLLDLARALRTIRLATLPPASSGVFQLQVSGGMNRTCSVQASTDLVNWLSVYTNTASTTGTFDFADGQQTNLPLRFYRAAASP